MRESGDMLRVVSLSRPVWRDGVYDMYGNPERVMQCMAEARTIKMTN